MTTESRAIRPERVAPTPLSDLVEGLGLDGDTTSGVAVSDVVLDSRQVLPGALYVALAGSRFHGAKFAAAAAADGAVAVLTDPDGEVEARAAGVPVVVTPDPRVAMALISARVFGHPAQKLSLLGVTGTNGKTTTVALLEAGLAAGGQTVGTIGTVGFRLGGVMLPSGRGTVTTPDSPDLQALLAVMADRGAETVALEVSSHALKMERVVGLEFDVAAFLNLGHDHLDFHDDIDDYFESKAKLFRSGTARRAVCWIDDEAGQEIARRAAAEGLHVVAVGTTEGADYRLEGYQRVAPLGGRAVLRHPAGEWDVRIALPGFHNMIDAAVALAMLDLAGHPMDLVLHGIATAQVPGRMQVVELPAAAPTVVVDFAHTPQAVAATLDALRPSFDRVITVVGCGGDRDVAKRPEMGRVAAERSEVVIITDDNPRSEDPAAIRAAMLEGANRVPGDVEVREVDGRRDAIIRALELAGATSVVAILGKGHEQGQQVGDRIYPFDDAVEARRAWDRVQGGEG